MINWTTSFLLKRAQKRSGSKFLFTSSLEGNFKKRIFVRMQSWSARTALPVTSQKLFKTRQRKGSWAETDIWKEKPKIYLSPRSDLPNPPSPLHLTFHTPPPLLLFMIFDIEVMILKYSFHSTYSTQSLINKRRGILPPPPSIINKQGVGKPPPPLYLRVFGNEWKMEYLDINIEISEY